jgi:hypothetical protein
MLVAIAWLLWGYGIPALSFWTGGVFLRRRGDDAPLRTAESAESCSRCCWRSRNRAYHSEGIPDRHVDADGRLPCALVHVLGAGAGRDRLAGSADPVAQTGSATGQACRAVRGVDAYKRIVAWKFNTLGSTGAELCFVKPRAAP